jgi:hypothetical protein
VKKYLVVWFLGIAFLLAVSFLLSENANAESRGFVSSGINGNCSSSCSPSVGSYCFKGS